MTSHVVDPDVIDVTTTRPGLVMSHEKMSVLIFSGKNVFHGVYFFCSLSPDMSQRNK